METCYETRKDLEYVSQQVQTAVLVDDAVRIWSLSSRSLRFRTEAIPWSCSMRKIEGRTIDIAQGRLCGIPTDPLLGHELALTHRRARRERRKGQSTPVW